MTLDSIEINKQIPQVDWLDYFDSFTDGNQGRHVTIEALDQEFGDQELIRNAPLWAIVYDPVNKGNDLIIETGKDAVAYAHIIDAPTEVWSGQDENGVVLALRITDAQGNHTLLKF